MGTRVCSVGSFKLGMHYAAPRSARHRLSGSTNAPIRRAAAPLPIPPAAPGTQHQALHKRRKAARISSMRLTDAEFSFCPFRPHSRITSFRFGKGSHTISALAPQCRQSANQRTPHSSCLALQLTMPGDPSLISSRF